MATQTTRSWWDALRAFASPKVSDQEVDRKLAELRKTMPVPVLWLLGKTQSGKTSLIRALTGDSAAEIGSGFRPCTKTARIYPFPAAEDPLVRFLDTRGLGEATYDPHEDLQQFQNQAHLLIVVMKALDHAQQNVIEAVKEIRARHPEWPLVVVQTSLHEAYPQNVEHIVPYPYATEPWPNQVPQDLARSLRQQRELFRGLEPRFVPVDFTLPEDGYEPVEYGLEQLWQVIDDLLPLGLRGMFAQLREARDQFRDMHFRKAHPHLISYALAASAAGAVPLPWIDIPVVLAIQGKMCHTIASIYNQPLTSKRLGEIGSGLGVGYLGRLGVREFTKFIPGVGSAVSGIYAGASTYALGRTLCAYFSQTLQGDVPSPDSFKRLYEEQFEQARKQMQGYLNRDRKPT